MDRGADLRSMHPSRSVCRVGKNCGSKEIKILYCPALSGEISKLPNFFLSVILDCEKVRSMELSALDAAASTPAKARNERPSSLLSLKAIGLPLSIAGLIA